MTTISILGGTGAMGCGLALRWAEAGFNVCIGSRDPERAQGLAEHLGREIRSASLEESVASGDVVVLAVPGEAQESLLRNLAPQFRPGSVVLDVIVHLAWGSDGMPMPAPGPSALEISRSILPTSVAVASGFHSVSATSLSDLTRPLLADVLVCGEPTAKDAIQPLVEAVPGLRYVDSGDMQVSKVLESMTALIIRLGKQHRSRRVNLRIGGLPDPRLTSVGHWLGKKGIAQLRREFAGQWLGIAVLEAAVDGRPLRGLLIAHGAEADVRAQADDFESCNPQARVEVYPPADVLSPRGG